jgi:murein tripeptide amidase MpaA
MYDHERDSPNRAAGHWHFQVQADAGTELTLVLHNFDNVWNGRAGSPVSAKTVAFTSPDGRTWRPLPAEHHDGNLIRLRLTMDAPAVYVARLEPYRLSDLARLLDEVRGNPLVEVTEIGRTVEGRPLEILRVGRPDAPRRVLLRARSHPWEPGGNWVIEGLVRSLLVDDETSRRCLERVCVYAMPLANKDGVARGMTRFNVMGKDLNRQWDKPADAALAPENAALERWLEGLIAAGRRPHFAVDFHNDEQGRIHVSRPDVDLAAYLALIDRYEALLRRHTWFTEGRTAATFRNPGSLGEGLLERYGVPACVQEMNCNEIAGLGRPPSAEAWRKFGADLRNVLAGLFEPAEGASP